MSEPAEDREPERNPPDDWPEPERNPDERDPERDVGRTASAVAEEGNPGGFPGEPDLSDEELEAREATFRDDDGTFEPLDAGIGAGDEPLPPPPPMAPPPPRPRAAPPPPPPAPGPDQLRALSGGAPGSPGAQQSEVLTAIQASRNDVTVDRDETPGYEPLEYGTGYMGTIAARKFTLDAIKRKWGGGIYNIQWLDQSGVAMSVPVEIPGKPKSVIDEKDRPSARGDKAPAFPSSVERGMPGPVERERQAVDVAKLKKERLEAELEISKIQGGSQQNQGDVERQLDRLRGEIRDGQLAKALEKIVEKKEPEKNLEIELLKQELEHIRATPKTDPLQWFKGIAEIAKTLVDPIVEAIKGEKSSASAFSPIDFLEKQMARDAEARRHAVEDLKTVMAQKAKTEGGASPTVQFNNMMDMALRLAELRSLGEPGGGGEPDRITKLFSEMKGLAHEAKELFAGAGAEAPAAPSPAATTQIPPSAPAGVPAPPTVAPRPTTAEDQPQPAQLVAALQTAERGMTESIDPSFIAGRIDAIHPALCPQLASMTGALNLETALGAVAENDASGVTAPAISHFISLMKSKPDYTHWVEELLTYLHGPSA